MTDFILQQEISFHGNQMKQNEKIKYLIQQNEQNQEYIKDLEMMLSVNKETIKIMTNSNSQNMSQLSTNNSNQDDEKKFINSCLIDENIKLFQQIQRITKERNDAQAIALVNLQIAQETQSHEKFIIKEMEYKIQELRRIIQEKENCIQLNEKNHPQQSHSNVFYNYREVLNVSEQVLNLKNDNILQSKIIEQISKQLQNLEHDFLQKTNQFNELKNEMMRLQSYIKSSINYQVFTNMIKNQELSKSLVDQLDLQGLFQTKSQKPIPKLNLLKAMEYQQQQLNVDRNLEKGSEQLKDQLNKQKQLFERELKNNELLVKNIKELKQFIDRMQMVNQSLKDSYIKQQKKIEYLTSQNNYYRIFYNKYLNQKKLNRSQSQSNFELQFLPYIQQIHLQNQLCLEQQQILEKEIHQDTPIFEKSKELPYLGENIQVNVSFLDQDNQSAISKIQQSDFKFTHETSQIVEAKKYLINMAIDLLQNQKFLNIGKNKKYTPQKKNRSYSNPIDYHLLDNNDCQLFNKKIFDQKLIKKNSFKPFNSDISFIGQIEILDNDTYAY